jgi:hypothetical protein
VLPKCLLLLGEEGEPAALLLEVYEVGNEHMRSTVLEAAWRQHELLATKCALGSALRRRPARGRGWVERRRPGKAQRKVEQSSAAQRSIITSSCSR